MKKVLIVISIIVCITAIYFGWLYKKVDPNVNSIERMDVMKLKAMLLVDGIYTENDKDKIKSVLDALKNRTREYKTERVNTYNYAIDMMVKGERDGGLVQYRYAIWTDKDGIYITMPAYSDKSYKLDKESAKIIEKFLTENTYSLDRR